MIIVVERILVILVTMSIIVIVSTCVPARDACPRVVRARASCAPARRARAQVRVCEAHGVRVPCV